MHRTCGKWQNVLLVKAKEGIGKTVLSVYIAAKDVLVTLISNKTERVNFKSGCVVWVTKYLEGDWFLVVC